MKLLVLAGGFGTRLRSVVADVPKALAPVGSVPFLELQMRHWMSQGLSEFIFLLHHQSDQIIEFLKSMEAVYHKDCQVDWLIEPTPLDTGGAIAHAVKKLVLTDDFLLTNADTWLGGGASELMKAVSPAIAVLNLLDSSRYGQVQLDQNNHVTAFVEKNEQRTAGWINAGLCRLPPDLFNDWNGQPFSLEREMFPDLVQSHSLKAVPLQTDFIDIGVPNDYHRFCCWIESGRQTPLCN